MLSYLGDDIDRKYWYSRIMCTVNEKHLVVVTYTLYTLALNSIYMLVSWPLF